MTPEELAAIREDLAKYPLQYDQPHAPITYARALLARIDAITEVIATMDPDEREGLPPPGWFFDGFYEARDKAEALLRGTPQR